MRRHLCLWAAVTAGLLASPAAARDRAIVDASTPVSQAVTIYRDPNRGTGDALNPDWPQGFAMISETRQVSLPPGRSTIRFTGVAEGMVAVSAIVTGLPGGTIEQNRNADLLSPAALVDGTLGNRVRITRTNPATGAEASESAIIRTRADGGLVLQTDTGFEAVRCSGLPERLSFDAMPDGLSAEPVFTIDTRDETGGTYTVTLSYLAWGFDWEASYVATIAEGGSGDDLRFGLTSWLTLLNDNGQSFEDATLLVVAGRLNVTSDYQALADPPQARPLRLTCYPLGSTASGSPPPPDYVDGPLAYEIAPAPAPQMMMRSAMAESAMPVMAQDMMLASEENLGDLKLYRVPLNATVAAQSLKQIAFLDRPGVTGRLLYSVPCDPWMEQDIPGPARMLLETVNDAEQGLGVALPAGAITVFARSGEEDLLIAEDTLRDYASGQDVELALGASSQVQAMCQVDGRGEPEGDSWTVMRATLTNANPHSVTLRLELGDPAQWRIDGLRTALKDGQRIAEITLAPNAERSLEWRTQPAVAD